MSKKFEEFFKTIPLTEVPKEYQQCDVIVTDIREEIANGRVGDFKIRPITDKDKELDEKFRKSERNCKICDKKMRNTSTLSSHMKNLHPEQLEGLLECQICQRKFIMKYAFERHMKVKHFDVKIQLFECDFCGKSTKIKSNMYTHIKIHLPTLNCDICQAELKQSTIKRHMKEIHAEDQKFQCEMCPKMFNTREKLKTHEKVHNKKFQCTACIKLFPTKFYLLKHQKEVHENPGSYDCEMCDKKCNSKRNLLNHLKIHDRNRPKPFKCQRCDYKTDKKAHFKRHQKGHVYQDKKFAAMKNPLKCPKCSALSSDKYSLSAHLKVVHLNEPFQCDLCGKYIKSMKSLKYHMNVQHQKKVF